MNVWIPITFRFLALAITLALSSVAGLTADSKMKPGCESYKLNRSRVPNL